MLIHMEIFFCIFTLMLGSWVVYYTFHLSRTTQHTFLKPMTGFILFYNLSILMRLIAQYTCANILASCFIFNASIYSRVLAPIAFFIIIGMTFFLISVILHFLGKSIPGPGKPWIFGGIFILLLGYSAKTFFHSQHFLFPWLPLFRQYIYLAVVFVAYFFLLFLLIFIRRESDHLKRQMVQRFAIFYIAAYTALILSFIFHPILQYFFVVVVHLLFNLFLILWLRNSFQPFHQKSVSVIMNEGLLEQFHQTHSISKREKEIAQLILEGKSNKEIEHQLFISAHTVKNHIYSLYQKVGVNSRSQLIHLILESNHSS